MNSKRIYRSPLFYVGDKYKLLPELKTLFPKKINRFIEPFVGGGSVFLNVKAQKYLLNDIDKNVIEIHKFLVSQSLKQDLFFKNVLQKIKEYGLSYSFLNDIVPNDLKNRWKKIYYAKFNKNAYQKLKNIYNSSSKKDILDLYLLLIYGFNRMLRFNSKGEFNLPVGNVDFNNSSFAHKKSAL